MTTRMLIDARHHEETRVAVLKGNRIEEFDFDSADHKQIKGNIYLAKVTRVEPSLQAAFVDFGGNRHGFLAFSEIHPDYYQIPKEDREALLAEEAAHAEEEAALRAVAEGEEDFVGDDDLGEGLADDFAGGSVEDASTLIEVDTSEKDAVATIEAGHVEDGFDDDHAAEENAEAEGSQRGRRRRQGRNATHAKEAEELRAKRMALRRRYKIQDVIHRRQVLLVQVVKEERGNKGAALTSYLSLAGRYCVLMPNSSHGGGISRKISSVADRKRLKSIIAEMDLPKSMGCIVRTAGLQRTKTEIKRDFDYLARLWDDIRETTLKSAAPALIHSDSDLIKRAIRDIYNREIEEVVVEGEAGYRAARDFMKLLMPSHARRVKAYVDPVPLFQRFGAEDQLTAMYDPVVQLKSGGYIVINPTEALVSIDINSGRSTKEHGIEQTAVATNLEAAREIARQLRLRDMAGLVVIDFIDMEYGSNVRKVEKAMKEALKNDRARIQVGRISSFGLMEMSRQRLRTGVLEATTRQCPHCDGSGLVRTAGSAGLSALRLIEDEAAKGKGTTITLFASQEAAIYVLNSKRGDLAEIEDRYGVNLEVIPEGENEGAKMRVVSSGPRNEFVPKFEAIAIVEEDDDLPEDIEDEIEDQIEAEDSAERADGDAEGDGNGRRKRRKRRRGRGRDRREDGTEGAAEDQSEDEGEGAEEGDEAEGDAADEAGDEADGEGNGEANGEDGPRKRRRRNRRRRGRGRGEGAEGGEGSEGSEGAENLTEAEAVEAGEAETQSPDLAGLERLEAAAQVAVEAEAPAPVVAEVAAEVAPEAAAEEAPKPKARRTRKKKVEAEAVEAEVTAEAPAVAEAEAEKPKPKRTRKKKVEAEPAEAEAAAEAPAAEAEAKPKRVTKPRAPRKKKADVAAVEAVAEAAPVEAPTEAPVAEAPAGEDDQGEAGDGPRKGWWQRTFGA
ncbi:MAG TPA: ribonuclease E/G [Novosphingobium sp.]|nr:ribonuclease E/G [Novosphingobium sp.]